MIIELLQGHMPHLGERLLITVTRKFDEFFVYLASPMVAPPYHSPNEPTGNRSSRHDYPPEMPDVGPPLVRADGRISFAADAISEGS